MIPKLDTLGKQAVDEARTAQDLDAVERTRIAYLGKKGAMSEVLRGLGAVAAAERPAVGAAANEWKRKIEEALDARKAALDAEALSRQLEREKVDFTAPARMAHRGSLHVVTQTARRMLGIFARLGFDVTTGPEAETEFLNFEAINIPKDHPARDMQDTFYLGPGVVLRTHTSPVQMRALRAGKWPVRVVCPGAVYRCDSDATHSPMFHQVEGLWVDRGVRMSDLKGVLEFFAQEMFGAETKIRLRPSYFPFVEPGAEVDVSCFNCAAGGTVARAACRVCKGTGWFEILGAGMVHPRLLEMAGYDPGEVSGFAFGCGIERPAMLLHRIGDLRHMFQGDIRFLKQF
ncbi:MAG: phenylalanine--tRNA ligase subunit alpha [Bdellovibrionota bacterium]